jgi:DNA primase catalytic core
MIAQASVQEVLDRADIIEIVGQFVRLKKRGTNYIANCPFHNEKSPSFSVSSSKGIYKCFGCGRGGNVLTFVQEHEKLTFVEAIRWLADFYKIALEETERSPEQVQHQAVEESLRVLNEFATQYFQDTLTQSEEGNAIGMSYFKQRGLRKDTIEKFRLGYNPEASDDFYRNAHSKGYSTELLIKSGIVKERNGMFYDGYRGRVIFPIQGNTGRVLGFGARILKKNDKAPKYINTPENELYIKSRVLYGMYQARQSVSKSDECFLVEGYLDVISLHQAGVENVVASSGTSLTEDQLRSIGQQRDQKTVRIQRGIDADSVIRCIAKGGTVIPQHAFPVVRQCKMYGMLFEKRSYHFKRIWRKKGRQSTQGSLFFGHRSGILFSGLTGHPGFGSRVKNIHSKEGDNDGFVDMPFISNPINKHGCHTHKQLNDLAGENAPYKSLRAVIHGFYRHYMCQQRHHKKKGIGAYQQGKAKQRIVLVKDITANGNHRKNSQQQKDKVFIHSLFVLIQGTHQLP